MTINLQDLTITKARAALLAHEYTSRQLTEAYLEVIKEKNKDINAFLEVFDDALLQAEAADVIYKNDTEKAQHMPLLGIPVATKDNILINGKHAQAASKILQGYVAPYDSTAAVKLRNAGAVFIGRTNMDEFAMGSSTENSAFGVTKNPYDTSRVAGGSSGGSAAALAMNASLVSLGSDTGGSIRQPGAFCGLVALKPTYGSVSRHGLMAMGSSLDVIGPFTKDTSDSEIVFNVLKGKDIMDMTSIELSKPDVEKQTVARKKIGIIKGVLDQGGIDVEVAKNFTQTIERFKQAGYEIIELEMPNMSYALAVYYVIMPAEISSNLARFDGVRFGLKIEGDTLLQDYLKTRAQGFGREVRRRIMLGTYVLSSGYHDAYYNKAIIVRNLLKKDYEKAFKDVDLVLTPTTPTPAFKIGEKTNDPVQMYLADIFTVTANLIGTPAISIPSGKTTSGLPLGIQLTAPHLREDLLFSAGKDFEKTA